jgi:hypothetical protein
VSVSCDWCGPRACACVCVCVCVYVWCPMAAGRSRTRGDAPHALMHARVFPCCTCAIAHTHRCRAASFTT